MLKQLLKKLESFIYRNDPAFIVSKKEKELRKELLRELSDEASYYTGRNITEEDIDGCESHTSFINVHPFQLKKHYNTNYWNSCYDTDKNKFIWNTIKNFYYECTKDLRE